MFATTKTLRCYERGFELNFVVYKAAYKQVEVYVNKQKPKDSKSQKKYRNQETLRKKLTLQSLRLKQVLRFKKRRNDYDFNASCFGTAYSLPSLIKYSIHL